MEGYDTYMAQVAEVSMKDGAPVVHKVTVGGRPRPHGQPGHGGGADPVEHHLRPDAALYGEITVDKGRVQQTNFDKYRLMRITRRRRSTSCWSTAPRSPGGIGEPATALIGPAVGNAIFAATGKRRAAHAVHGGEHRGGVVDPPCGEKRAPGRAFPFPDVRQCVVRLNSARRGASRPPGRTGGRYACSRLERGTLASRNSIWSARMRRPRRIMSSCRLGT